MTKAKNNLTKKGRRLEHEIFQENVETKDNFNCKIEGGYEIFKLCSPYDKKKECKVGENLC